MGFVNDLGKKTTETTTKIAREAKLKMKITENKGKIKDLYEELGRKVYENHVREESIDINEFINDDCSKIDVLSKCCLPSNSIMSLSGFILVPSSVTTLPFTFTLPSNINSSHFLLAAIPLLARYFCNLSSTISLLSNFTNSNLSTKYD